MLVIYTNLHNRHKVFQVAHESRDCTQSIWIIVAVLSYFHRGRQKGIRYQLWHWIMKISIITRPYKQCT